MVAISSNIYFYAKLNEAQTRSSFKVSILILLDFSICLISNVAIHYTVFENCKNRVTYQSRVLRGEKIR